MTDPRDYGDPIDYVELDKSRVSPHELSYVSPGRVPRTMCPTCEGQIFIEIEYASVLGTSPHVKHCPTCRDWIIPGRRTGIEGPA